ncbi:cyclic nucleotide-binding protein [Trypanosoma conorhini]|uniref:Cyclic nucleotide-binding protein n=1 Tax=Trypanosoma conorhini TaxID=83891 RepID=A0A3R7PUJ3_9TRYP|nr:cyclic nucleotide-binding protein [Trypanosoma conorhini]RNF25376.1 cyclic nucleotide-binding protein [Trypanosoma conorhini]
MANRCGPLSAAALAGAAEHAATTPGTENAESVGGSTYAATAGSTTSEAAGGRPTRVVARAIEDVMRSLEHARVFAHKNFWHEDESYETSSSCMNVRAEDGKKVCHSLVPDPVLAKGLPTHDEAEMLAFLQNTEHLYLLRPEEMREAARASLRREYLPGEVVLPEGDHTLHVYIVVCGEVEVFAPNKEDTAAHHAWTRTQPRAHSQGKMKKSWSCSADGEYNFLDSFRAGDEPDTSRVPLGSGSFSLQEEYKAMTHCGKVKPGMLFGLELCVLGDPSPLRYVAGQASNRTVLALIPLPLLRQLLEQNPPFAQSVGRRVGEGDVFIPVREFCRYVFMPSAAMNEYLPLWTILDCYTKIENVIHTKLKSNEIDAAAWGYALRRLPENVTTTFSFNLVVGLPPFVATRMREEAKKADVRHYLKNAKNKAPANRTAVTYIRTKERRRCTWQLGMEGKALVLLRDGYTDLLDFLSMLCVHIIESNKLRGRVQGMVHPPAIDVLDEYLQNREADESAGIVRDKAAELERVREVLKHLPLTREEQKGLLEVWQTDCLVKIYEVMMHREEFNVRVDPSVSRRFQTNPFVEWALNLRACIMQQMGMGRNWAPPDDLCIDIVSSNTHCIKNLLSSFHRKQHEVMEEYAKRDKRLGSLESWHTLEDALYASTTGVLSTERTDLIDEYAKALEESGIMVLADTAMTGLQVDIIPVHAINFETIDSVIRGSLKRHFSNRKRPSSTSWSQVCKPRASSIILPDGAFPSFLQDPQTDDSRLDRHFIINMDFAFGAQAEGICRAIFSVFGQRIRSVNVIGKAGGFIGKRGDIQLPKEVLMSKSGLLMEDQQDELRRCRNQGLTAGRLRELAGPKVSVHEGRLLTIAGTMLQNVRMLEFYKRIWGCVGAEMEASYFARVIEDFHRQGIANPALATRFAYYTSDLPLEGHNTSGAAGASLSAPMTLGEGVPPLYAIARGIVENILLHD